MAEEHWQSARLIPTSGINGQDEAERRATSALLAVATSVKEFGVALTKPLGAPAGRVDTYIEVQFKTADERTVIPDGLIEITRGAKTWTVFVEVKTGAAELDRPQIESYLDVARDNGFDAVLTISNQMAPALGVHPVTVDGRKLKKVALHHLSWAEVLTMAVQQRVHRGVSDPDQAWILGELIRYLEHPKSGALDFTDMGGAWVTVRESIAAGTLRANDKGLADVVSRWEQLLRFSTLRLGRELGADVQVLLTRKQSTDPSTLLAEQAESLVSTGLLTGSIRIPEAIGLIAVTADLRANLVTVSVDVEAPREGRPATKVNWLIRQLKEAPGGLRIDAFAQGSRISSCELLKDVRSDPGLLVPDARRDLRLFRVAATSPVGPKRGTGRGSFIDSVLTSIDGFYGAVVQQLRPWAAKAPQMPKGDRTATEQAGIDTTPPLSDLLEPSDGDRPLSPVQDATDANPSFELAGVDMVEAPDPTAGEPTQVEPDLVSWDQAQDRLDHERSPMDDHTAANPREPSEV